MSQTFEIQLDSIEEILQILRNQALSMTCSSTSARYLNALNSFQTSVHGEQAFQPASPSATSVSSEESLSSGDSPFKGLERQLTDWLVSQWVINTPFSTASLHLDIISSLYGSAVKGRLLPPTKLFSRLKSALKELGPEGWKQGIDDEIFDRALRLTKNARCLISDDATAAQMVIWSLTHSLMPLTDIALLKKKDLSADTAPQGGLSQGDSEDNLSFIINNLSLKSQRKQYLFPLKQSQRTPKQLSKYIANIVNSLFKRARLPQATDPFQTVEALWAYAALRAGIPASVLVSHLGHAPLGLPILKLCGSSVFCIASSDCGQVAKNNSSLIIDNLSLVGKVFLENPPLWYAMSLRPGVRFTQVCRRIELLGHRLPDIQLYYPSEEITRAIGKKIVTRQRPFIYSVVFFRAKLTDIGRLFTHIGDLAWCYRQSARPGAPYADISDTQFRLFQQTIARFTPDYEVAPSGELELNEGDRVEILGGLFSGQEATFDTAAHVTEADVPTVYRLNIIGDNGIEWRISVDSRLAKRKIDH